MGSIKTVFLTVLSFITIVYTVSCIINFTKFLSNIPRRVNSNLSTSYADDSSVRVPYTTEAVVVNVSLLCIFMIVHSSLIPIPEIISNFVKMPFISRMIYSLLSSASLQVLIRLWMPIPQYTLWNVDTQEITRLILGIHIVSWSLIFSMIIAVDVTELLGVKQVYYHTTGRPQPSTMKSESLRLLHKKMRHPSLLGFTIIFWIHPCMSLDRLLLALLWTMYMVLCWRPNIVCYNYVVQQYLIKKSAL